MSATGWVACGLALAFIAAAIVIWLPGRAEAA